MNKENLLRMADHIETVPKRWFDMRHLRIGDFISQKCNSVGGILGHSVELDSKENIDRFRRDDGKIKFWEWGSDFTGLKMNSGDGEYLFSAGWKYTDNTPNGAAKRIRYFVKNGLPKNWLDQMKGDAPLPYL